MHSHKFNYPANINPCRFCGSEDVALDAALIRLNDGHLTTLFNLGCTECGYTTRDYEYPDIAAHAWNMAAKLEINALLDAVADPTEQ